MSLIPPLNGIRTESPLETALPRKLENPMETHIFQAAYPPTNYKVKALKVAAAVIIFPIGICWIIKKIAEKTLAFIAKLFIDIGQQAFPAPNFFNEKEKEEFRLAKKNAFEDPNQRCTRVSFKSADGVLLEGAIAWSDENDFKSHTTASEAYGNKKWILLFNPNAMCFEQNIESTYARNYSDFYDCNVMIFNYRGVLDSQGNAKAIDDLVLDGDAAFQYLLAKGVPSTSILIDGFSIGGGVGTYVRALHPEGPIVNQKSFSSISNVVKGKFYDTLLMAYAKKGRVTQTQKFIAKSAASVVGVVVGAVMRGANWELNPASKWSEIKGYKWITTSDNDSIMRRMGTFYAGVKARLKGYRKVDKSDPKNDLQVHKNRELKATLNHVKSIGTEHTLNLTSEARKKFNEHFSKAFKIDLESIET